MLVSLQLNIESKFMTYNPQVEESNQTQMFDRPSINTSDAAWRLPSPIWFSMSSYQLQSTSKCLSRKFQSINKSLRKCLLSVKGQCFIGCWLQDASFQSDWVDRIPSLPLRSDWLRRAIHRISSPGSSSAHGNRTGCSSPRWRIWRWWWTIFYRFRSFYSRASRKCLPGRKTFPAMWSKRRTRSCSRLA